LAFLLFKIIKKTIDSASLIMQLIQIRFVESADNADKVKTFLSEE